MSFGRDGAQIPMMREWAEILTRHLGVDASLVGLSTTLDGPAFEERLGVFLQRVAALKLAGPMLEDLALALGPEWSAPRRAGLDALGWTNRHANAVARLDHVIGLIHGSLYAQFGAANIDLFGASRAFAALLTSLEIHPRSNWAYATTNYDVIPDHVVSGMGMNPDHGAIKPVEGGTPVLRVDGLLDGMSRYVPVLHLHGRVGWLRRADDASEIEVENARAPLADHIPIIELPGLNKNYGDSVISALWEAFRLALARAKRVLVLGHSLNDDALAAAIRENAAPDSVAVSVLAEPNNRTVLSEEGKRMKGWVADKLPSGTATIPMYFDRQYGSNGQHSGLEAWLNATR